MIPRPEHPKPQFCRETWRNLNGIWDFSLDNGRSGEARNLHSPEAKFPQKILVPFCPESGLSGIGHTDFIYGVWYRRSVVLTPEQLSGRAFLHFGAVDYEAIVYVNGQRAGTHRGGYVSFRLEITELVHPGENVITVNALDDTRDPRIPSGKQCHRFHSYGCFYTRTTGIWQTVWLEFTPRAYIDSVVYETDIHQGVLLLTANLVGSGCFSAEASYEGKPMGKALRENARGQVKLMLPLEEIHLWEVGAGHLYDLQLRFGEDRVCSYFGLRQVQLEGMKFLLNGKCVFQRLILDQGFYPDGIYTAPTDEALQQDIRLSMAMGFNGARLHEKIFEERFLYHCDRMGYLVWGEYPNWGMDHTDPDAIYSILPEWLEEISRDRNHPAIIGWCPFNETWDQNGRQQYNELLRQVYLVTKGVDPTRPCIDTSGNYHVLTDIFDVHDYNQDPVTFRADCDQLMTEGRIQNHANARQEYRGGPVFMSEYGGIRFLGTTQVCDEEVSWGYGEDVSGLEGFRQRFRGLTDALLDNSALMGLCYTQLTDVEQEQNGLLTYQRVPKFDLDWLRSVVGRKAAIETE